MENVLINKLMNQMQFRKFGPDSSSLQRQCPEIHWLVVESEEQLMDAEGERHVARVAMDRVAGCGAAEHWPRKP